MCCNPNRTDQFHKHGLIYAVSRRSHEFVKDLCECYPVSKVNLADRNGLTALEHAALKGYFSFNIPKL